jgi:hypothetical protein
MLDQVPTHHPYHDTVALVSRQYLLSPRGRGGLARVSGAPRRHGPLTARKTKLMRREANPLLRLTFAAGTLPPLPRLARLSVPYLSTRGDLPVHFGD